MPRQMRSASLLFLILTGIAGPLSAQSLTSGALTGSVRGPMGEPLAGARVTVTSAALIGAKRSVISDRQGVYQLAYLPPGEYCLDFFLTGYDGYTTGGVALAPGERRRIDAVLAIQDPPVGTPNRLFDASAEGAVESFNGEQLRQFPPANRAIEDVIKYIPGVTGIRMDVLTGREGGLPDIRGGGYEGNEVFVDGLSARDPEDFSLALGQNFDSIESLAVFSDPFSPEFGKLLGGAVDIVTRTGGNTFSAELGLQYRNDSLTSSREPVATPYATRGYEEKQAWANIGGYFIKERWWFFLSYNTNQPTSDGSGAAPLILPASSLVHLDGSPVSDDYVLAEFPAAKSHSDTRRIFFKTTGRLTANQEIALSYLDSNRDYLSATGLPATFPAGDTRARRWRANYSLFGEAGVLEIRAGFQESDILAGAAADMGIAARHLDDYALQFANRDKTSAIQNQRDDFALKFTTFWDAAALGRHEFSLGASFEEVRSRKQTIYTGFDELVFPQGHRDHFTDGAIFRFQFFLDQSDPAHPLIYLDENGDPILIPKEVRQYDNVSNENRTTSTGFYLEDRIAIGNWTMMLGLRSDEADSYNSRGEPVIHWGYDDFLSPRFSLIYDVIGDQNHVLKMSYGLFKDTATIQLAQVFNPFVSPTNFYAFVEYGWEGATNQPISESELHDPANWRLSGRLTSLTSVPRLVDPKLQPNENERYAFEYNWRLRPTTAFTARFVQGTSDELIEEVQVFSDFENDATNHALLTNFEFKKRHFRALDLIFQGSFRSLLDYYLALTLTDIKGTNPGNFEPTTHSSSTGNGNFVSAFGDAVPSDGTSFGDYWAALFQGLGGVGIGDEGWYGPLSDATDTALHFIGNWSLPFRLDLETGLQFVDGFHYSRKGYQAAYQDFFTFPEGRGTYTTTATYWLDLSLSRPFIIGNRHQVTLRLDAFNLTDQQRPISIIEEDTEDFGETFARQSPRAFQFGLQYKF